MKTIAIPKPRGTTMHVLALLRATALSCVLFASSPLSADVWVAGDARIAKLATSGQTLATVDSVFGRGFAYGVGIQDIIGVEQRNGHVWVSDVNNNRVFELDPDGKPLREITLLSPFGIGYRSEQRNCVDVNPPQSSYISTSRDQTRSQHRRGTCQGYRIFEICFRNQRSAIWSSVDRRPIQ